MKILIAAVCLAALGGVALLLVTPRINANEPVALSALPEADHADGCAEEYQRLYELRMQRIADLELYAANGVFPVNDYGINELTSVFVDKHGTACAVGHLMRCAGEGELVDKVANESRFVKLHELDEGPVIDWILNSGLTKEECELIQPAYWDDPREPIEPDPLPLARLADRGAQFIQHHLQSTARKLRKDTRVSLVTAMQRLHGVKFEIVESSGMHRAFTNESRVSSFVRATRLEATGEIATIGEWREVEPGQSFYLEESNCLLEWSTR